MDRPTFTKRDSEYKSNGHKLLQHQLLFGFTLGCPYLSAQHGWRNAVDEMTADLADVHRAWLELDNRDAELLYLPSTVSTRQLVGATDANFDPELLIT